MTQENLKLPPLRTFEAVVTITDQVILNVPARSKEEAEHLLTRDDGRYVRNILSDFIRDRAYQDLVNPVSIAADIKDISDETEFYGEMI